VINKVEQIIQAIEARLVKAGIPTVLRFPEDYRSIGNRYPMAIIREERQDYELTAGQRYQYNLTVTIVLVSDKLRERMKVMNELQVAVFNELFKDCTLDGLVMNINPVTVNMGMLLSGSDITATAGFNEAVSFREIQLQMLVQDARI